MTPEERIDITTENGIRIQMAISNVVGAKPESNRSDDVCVAFNRLAVKVLDEMRILAVSARHMKDVWDSFNIVPYEGTLGEKALLFGTYVIHVDGICFKTVKDPLMVGGGTNKRRQYSVQLETSTIQKLLVAYICHQIAGAFDVTQWLAPRTCHEGYRTGQIIFTGKDGKEHHSLERFGSELTKRLEEFLNKNNYQNTLEIGMFLVNEFQGFPKQYLDWLGPYASKNLDFPQRAKAKEILINNDYPVDDIFIPDEVTEIRSEINEIQERANDLPEQQPEAQLMDCNIHYECKCKESLLTKLINFIKKVFSK